MPPTNQFLEYTHASPAGASTNSYGKASVRPAGVIHAYHYSASGDGADNPELEARVKITPANCALPSWSRPASTPNQFNANGHSGVLKVNTTASGGTALWLRGFEYTNDPSLLPPDDPTTVQNETIEYLKSNAVWKFETVILGPFDFSDANGSCPLLIPFTLDSGNLDNLVLAVDTVGKTSPFQVTCPSDQVFNCGDTVKYAAANVNGGCGNITATWSLPENYAFPINVPTQVTVTAADGDGVTASCTFNVTVVDNKAPVVPALPDVNVGQCSGTPPIPVAMDSCAGPIQGKTKTHFPITQQGTTVVTWSFDDGHGNVSTGTQNVIVKNTTPPVIPNLPDLVFSCSTPAIPPTPTATDTCKGPVPGTTSTTFPITTLGTTLVTWTFTDSYGNVATATQKVIVTGLTFEGFYSPIGGVNGTCSTPFTTSKQGSVLPIKFDMLCGTSPVTSGTPPVVQIQQWVNCAPVGQPLNVQAVYQNNWHYNWDTSAYSKGIYKVIVILVDGTSSYVFVQLK